MDPSRYLPLKPLHYLILLSLSETSLHGYALKKDIVRRTDGHVEPGAGSLYRSIGQLVDQGLIRPDKNRPHPGLDDPRRTYFAMTDRGRTVAMAETERLGRLVRSAHQSGLGTGVTEVHTQGGAT